MGAVDVGTSVGDSGARVGTWTGEDDGRRVASGAVGSDVRGEPVGMAVVGDNDGKSVGDVVGATVVGAAVVGADVVGAAVGAGVKQSVKPLLFPHPLVRQVNTVPAFTVTSLMTSSPPSLPRRLC